MNKAITKRSGIRYNTDDVIRDLKRTSLPLSTIGKKYGVTRQALSVFMKRAGFLRPLRTPRVHNNQADNCFICQRLIKISKEPHSEFLTSHTVRDKLGPDVSYERYLRHLKILKERGLVHPKFGCLISKRIERAYSLYFSKRLPVYKIGRMVGLKNFAGIIRRHHEYGWEIPPSLFVYDGKERSRVLKGIRHWSQDGRDPQKKGTQ